MSKLVIFTEGGILTEVGLLSKFRSRPWGKEAFTPTGEESFAKVLPCGIHRILLRLQQLFATITGGVLFMRTLLVISLLSHERHLTTGGC